MGKLIRDVIKKERIMDRPYVICHMLTSLDGKIDGEYMSSDICVPALKAYGELRNFYKCQAVLYGTTTMAQGYSDGLVKNLPVSDEKHPIEDYIAAADANNYIISLDPKGELGFHSNYIQRKNRPKSHVIEVLTEGVTNDYLSYLRELNISYLFAGKKEIDCRLLLNKLYRIFAIKRIMVAGGGITNWSFAVENLIDELSLVIAPVADGNNTSVSIFERAKDLPLKTTVSFKIKEATPLECGILWLRYLTE